MFGKFKKINELLNEVYDISKAKEILNDADIVYILVGYCGDAEILEIPLEYGYAEIRGNHEFLTVSKA